MLAATVKTQGSFQSPTFGATNSMPKASAIARLLLRDRIRVNRGRGLTKPTRRTRIIGVVALHSVVLPCFAMFCKVWPGNVMQCTVKPLGELPWRLLFVRLPTPLPRPNRSSTARSLGRFPLTWP